MSFIKFKKGKQRYLVSKAIEIAGSERKLEKISKIPKSSIYGYKNELYNLPLERAKILAKICKIDFNILLKKWVEKILPHNWKEKLGGKKRIELAIKEGKFEEMIRNIQRKSLLVQAKYRFKTLRGEMVRNDLEMNIANFLYLNNIDYIYEPYIKINNNRYFPDFLIPDWNLIIECTKAPSKLAILMKKINDYKSKGYRIKCIISDEVFNNYKTLKSKYKLKESELIDKPR
ncbi:MAG: hypothetical protein J7K26_02950 [Candidatus Aenigmarchaeota archaeon]|nr:hypothetical protein [Candidatus Aenigmarchaeota archaeon]